jgi:excisionase family DNA binding protein
METKTEQPELMTVDETIRVLRLGRTRVNEILRSGDLPSYKLGRRRLVRRRDVEEWIERHKDVLGAD